VPTTSTPKPEGVQAGLVGDAAAVSGSAEINQLLGTHADTVIYQGSQILFPDGTGGSPWAVQLSTQDVDQPFTMSGTAVGRVAIPLLAVGNGADLLVSLCADNGSGKPGTMITQTRIPAKWVMQQSVVTSASVPVGASPGIQFTDSPIAVAQNYSIFASAPEVLTWAAPAGPDSGYIKAWGTVGTESYFIIVGGVTSATNVVVSSVFTVPCSGTTANISTAVPQPAMPGPLYLPGAAVQTDPSSGTQTLIVAGGVNTVAATVPLNTVYAAQYDPTTGTVSSWSSQTTLPVPLASSAVVAYGSYVYVIGGYTTGVTPTNTAYYAQVVNGQITSWSATTSLPGSVESLWAAVVDDFLFIGPYTGGPQNYYYAAINANGTLGPWLSTPAYNQAGPIFAVGDYGVYTDGGLFNGVFTGPVYLTTSPNGPDVQWEAQNILNGAQLVTVSTGNTGQWEVYAISTFGSSSEFIVFPVNLTPMISVPLPATGLTNGSTYHVLMQQQGGDDSDYLLTHYDVDVFPGNPTLLTSAQNAYLWTANPAGQAVPLRVFDQTVVGTPWHAWEETGSRISTFIYATTPNQSLIGLCEVVRTLTQLNVNAGFESGLSPWTATGGSAIQSSTRAFSGIYSAQVTPSGSATQAYIQSEFMQCLPGQQITVSGYFWFTNAVTTNASLSVNWWNQSGSSGYISTSSNNVSVPAATWTLLTNTFTAPAGAYQFTLDPALSGTPAAANVFYVDQVYATSFVTPQQSTVVAIDLPGTWPGQTWPPLGTTVLA
jgi:hypothetical protein